MVPGYTDTWYLDIQTHGTWIYRHMVPGYTDTWYLDINLDFELEVSKR